MALTVTTRIKLDDRLKKGTRPDPDKKFPVKLRVTYESVHRYYSIIDPIQKKRIYLTKAEYIKVENAGARGTAKDIKMILDDAERRAHKIIGELTVFTFPAFDKKFNTHRRASGDVLAAFDEYVKELEKDDRIGTAVSYGAAKKSLSTYAGESLSFNQVNAEWLKKYEKWMLGKEKSTTTIGIYCRALRTILNRAISEGLFKREDYPFGKGKYEIPATKNIKKALDKSDVAKIFHYTPVGEWERRAKDFWLSSYLCNGMNMKDIAMLKRKSLNEDRIEYIRAKTANTRRTDSQPIAIYITKDIRAIIKRQEVEGVAESYLFDILKPNQSPKEQYAAIQQFTKMVNKYIGKIAEDLKIKKTVRTYTARHSSATILLRAGVGVEFISAQLGHANIKTTQSYLGSFDKDTIKDNASKLTDF